MPPTEPTTDIELFAAEDSAYPVLFAQDGGVAEVIEDNFGDEGFSPSDLDRLKVPAGGGRAWDIPDEEPSSTIEGVIVHRQPTRSFWFQARGEGGEEDGPPDCSSPDAKIGIGVFGPGSQDNPSGECAECPMNVFGSSDRGSGEGKACKEQMQLFMLQQEAILPVQISLPPTSLKPWRKYMTRCASKGKSFYAVVTRLGLEVEKKNGQTYSVVAPAKVSDLHPEEAKAAKLYGSTIKAYLDAAAERREHEVAAGELTEGDAKDDA